MDLRKIIKMGDKVIALKSGRVFNVKYFLSNTKIIVNNGIFDFPLSQDQFIIYSPLMEALLCQT